MKTISTDYKNRIKNVDTCASVPFKLKAFIRFSEWANVGTPSAGFNELGTIDLTPYIPKGSNVTINIDIENSIQGEANYGLLQASQFKLTLAEATERGDTVAIGELLQNIMLEAATPYYQYEGDDVHLWELVVRLGDVDGTDYVEHAFVIEWLYDTTNDEPSWTGIRRHNPKFTLTGFTLIKKLAYLGTAEIFFDMSNKSGVYYDDSEDEAGDLDFTDVMNCPLYPYVLSGLKNCGIEEDNISIEMPPDNDGSTLDFSSIDVDIIETPPAAQKGFANQEHPTPCLWKTSGTKEYYVWISRYFYLNVCVVDTDTGEMTTNDLNPFTGTGITGTTYCRRLWYPLTGDIFYSLCFKSASPNEWYVIKSTLTDSGATGTADDITISNTSQQLDLASAPLSGIKKLYWLQTDYDTAASPDRLWCVLHDLTPATYTGCLMGYFSINFSGSAAWTSVKLFDSELSLSMRIFVDGAEDDADAVGGFRVLRNDSAEYATCSYAWYQDGADWKLCVVAYDENEDVVISDDIELGGTLAKDDPYVQDAIMGGNGTVGGFYRSDEDSFYFVLPSFETGPLGSGDYTGGQWVIWRTGALSGPGWSIPVETNVMYRCFASTGTVSGVTWIRCMEYMPRIAVLSTPASTSYYGRMSAAVLTASSETPSHTLSSFFDIADGTETYPNRKWTGMSSPALAVSDTGASVEDRPFTIMKLWGVDADGDDYAGYFLTTYSENLWHQVSYDFADNNPSIAEFFKQIARDYQLLINIEFAGTIIRPRNQTGTTDETITTAMFALNGQEGDAVPRYASVRITCNQDGNDYIATGGNPNSRNVLAFSTDFLVASRCQVRANQLFTDWQYNQVMYDLEARGLIWLEPGDYVTFSKVMPPGGAGYVSISGVVQAVSLSKNMQTQLKVRSLNTTQLSNL